MWCIFFTRQRQAIVPRIITLTQESKSSPHHMQLYLQGPFPKLVLQCKLTVTEEPLQNPSTPPALAAMVVNSVHSSPSTLSGVVFESPANPSSSIDRQYSFYHPRPFVFSMYSPSHNPYYGPSHPGGPVSAPGPYPVYSAADSSQGHGTKYGPPPSGSGYGGGSGHGGSSYGPPSGGYEYHPAPHPPHTPPHPHPIPIHISKPKSKKGKGAALSALTLLAFLYFLNMLQSCLKEHMDTMNPTVMVMTAGATRRKDVDEMLVDEKDEMLGEYDANGDGYEAIDGKYHLLTTSANRTQHFGSGGKQIYKIRKTSASNQRHRDVDGEVIYYDYY